MPRRERERVRAMVRRMAYWRRLAAVLTALAWLCAAAMLLANNDPGFDFGVFVTMLVDEPQAIMIVYVVAIHLVAAVVNIIRTVGNKKDGNPGWKIDFAQFFGNLAQVVLCLVFIGHVEIPVYIYCIGEIYASVLKIISSCKKTAIVYVQ